MKPISLLALGCALLGLASPSAVAAPGEVDRTFGVGGAYRFPPGQGFGPVRPKVSSQDLIYVLWGQGPCADSLEYCGSLVRLSRDGIPDETFGPAGAVTVRVPRGGVTTIQEDLHLLPGGKILFMSRRSDGFLYGGSLHRLNADGSPDPSFDPVYPATPPPEPKLHGGNPPPPATAAFDFGVDALGRILFAGAQSMRRHLPDGTVDAAFNQGAPLAWGTQTGVIRWDMVEVRADGGAYLAGGNRVQALRPDGSIDASFASNGSRAIAVDGRETFVRHLVLQADGRLLLSGIYRERATRWVPFVSRLLPSGADDPSFGSAGTARLSALEYWYGDALIVQPDGGVLVVGTRHPGAIFSLAAVVRLTPSGEVDTAFGEEGVAYVDLDPDADRATGAALQSDGRLLLGLGGSGIPFWGVARLKTQSDPIRIAPARVPTGGAQVAYGTRFFAAGGSPPYTYSLVGGRIPAGIALVGDTLVGTPAARGESAFTVEVTDAAGSKGTRTHLLMIVDKALLVTRYYERILSRTADAGGEAFWEGEVDRLAAAGASVGEVFGAMAIAFFGSAEYASASRTDAQFVEDLYRTFFQRPADEGGLAFWTGQIAAGKPRAAVLVDFLFSSEFQGFMDAVFGVKNAGRTETSVTLDFYRGLLGRLPDSNGLAFWTYRFRAAQCANVVASEADSISFSFLSSAEYTARQAALPPGERNRGYVVDLYGAFLRRGGDLGGFQFWVGQLDSGAMTREQLRRQFIDSPEFRARIEAMRAEGCVSP